MGALLLASVLAGCGAGPVPAATPTFLTPTATAHPATAPAPTHVWLIVMENRAYGQVIGSAGAPYLNELAARYALATDSHGVAHPSEPNYLALWSGSTQGVSDDGIHNLAAPTLADQLDAAGRTWRVFAEHVPGGCYTGATAYGGRDGPGWYARKHEPAISFRAVSGSPALCARIVDFTAFDPAAGTVTLVVPDTCHDMHDCSTQVGDAWLRSFVPRITDSAAWRAGGVLFITFDEGAGPANHVATLIVSPRVLPGARWTARLDHDGLLRTIEDLEGLPCLAGSCAAAPLTGLLRP